MFISLHSRRPFVSLTCFLLVYQQTDSSHSRAVRSPPSISIFDERGHFAKYPAVACTMSTKQAPNTTHTPSESRIISQQVNTERLRLSKMSSKLNSSYLTDGTETTSFSEEGDCDEQESMHFDGAIRIDDFLCSDEKDSIADASTRSSLDNLEDEDFALNGLPREIMVFSEDSVSSDQLDDLDIHQRLQIAETLAHSYKAKMQSTEELTDNLHEYLRQAQAYAEDVLADRNELLQQIQEMQEEEQTIMDQNMLIKAIMASSLCYYLLGGSSIFLTCSVGLHLLADACAALL